MKIVDKEDAQEAMELIYAWLELQDDSQEAGRLALRWCNGLIESSNAGSEYDCCPLCMG